MKDSRINILRPRTTVAKWLVFCTLALVLGLGATGYFDVIRDKLDTDSFSSSMGDCRNSFYDSIKAVLLAILIYWTAAITSGMVGSKIGRMRKLRVANRELIKTRARFTMVETFEGGRS